MFIKSKGIEENIMRIILLSVLILLSTNIVLPKEPSWLIKLKQLAPLQSTEKNVEEIFGKAVETQPSGKDYKTNNGFLRVTYSTGECRENWNEYNVEKGKVISATFFLDKPIKFKSLKIDISNFEKEESSDTPNVAYKNLNAGIIYDIYIKYEGKVELLTNVSIYPANKFSYLECASK